MTGTEIVALVAWYAFIAVCILAFYLLADAATLSMTGSCTGQGFTNISVEADLLVAAINQTANGTSWSIVAGGI